MKLHIQEPSSISFHANKIMEVITRYYITDLDVNPKKLHKKLYSMILEVQQSQNMPVEFTEVSMSQDNTFIFGMVRHRENP